MAAASAAACARRALLRSSSSSHSLKSFLFSPGAASKMAGFSSATPTPTSARFSRTRLPFTSRLPVELGCAQSLMPLHSVTAAALLTSKLSKFGSWGWLSEGFATPL